MKLEVGMVGVFLRLLLKHCGILADMCFMKSLLVIVAVCQLRLVSIVWPVTD